MSIDINKVYEAFAKLDTPKIDSYYNTVSEDIPAYKHNIGDAGYDMYVTKDTWIWPFKVTKIPVNFKAEIPKGHFGLMTSRSGESLKGNFVIPGIVDSTYRGQIQAIVTRVGLLPRRIKKGTRIAQLIVIPYREMNWKHTTATLTDTNRGENGFGSTGVA